MTFKETAKRIFSPIPSMQRIVRKTAIVGFVGHEFVAKSEQYMQASHELAGLKRKLKKAEKNISRTEHRGNGAQVEASRKVFDEVEGAKDSAEIAFREAETELEYYLKWKMGLELTGIKAEEGRERVEKIGKKLFDYENAAGTVSTLAAMGGGIGWTLVGSAIGGILAQAEIVLTAREAVASILLFISTWAATFYSICKIASNKEDSAKLLREKIKIASYRNDDGLDLD